MMGIKQDEFLSNLRATQQYCAQQLQYPPASTWAALRSLLQPFYKDSQWFVTNPVMGAGSAVTLALAEWTRHVDPFHNSAGFKAVFASQLARKAAFADAADWEAACQGRILVVNYELNIPDGVVEIETAGFFDEFDLPPIDTWFYHDYSELTGGILFAWIPKPFLSLAEEAISIHFLNILHWFVTPAEWLADPRVQQL